MRTAFRFIIILVLFALVAIFNIGLVDIRIQEINYLLGKVAVEGEASNALGIVSKYELIKRRLETGEQDMQNYEFEAKMQALTSGDQINSGDSAVVRKLYIVPIKAVVNGIRFALGKEIIKPQEEDKIFKVLEIGYFWERTRKYPEAIKIYDDVLGMEGLSPNICSAVLLHKAFCHSMMNDYKTASTIYSRVISQYPNTDAGMIAWKLLDFIDSMEKKREKLKEENLDDFEKAKQYYLLMDYRNAIKFFARFLGRNEESPLKPEGLFFKGRSHEELGETQESVDEYRRVIRIDKSKHWAREANRRLLMLGEFYEQKKQMAEEARRQLVAYQDQGFMNNVEQFASLVGESSLKGELMKDEGAKDEAIAAAPDKKIMALINSIGDLTGQKEALKREKIEEQRKKWIEEQNMTATEVKELDRMLNLIQNPARQPNALGRIIRDNSIQLRYIYNKRLRQGVPLSGKMIVEIKIKSDGTVATAKVMQSNLGDEQFENDILNQIGDWKFKPVPDSLGTYTLSYPFEFFQEG